MSKPTPSQPQPLGTAEDEIQNPKFAASTLDFLLIELVPTVQRTTEQALEREQKLVDEYKRSRICDGEGARDQGRDGDGEKEGEAEKEVAMTSLGFPLATSETREAMQSRLDAMGYRVGQGLVERFSLHTPRPQSPLDTIKFICKDLWTLLHRKPIDNLKTNHRGIYVLSDSRFPPLSRISIDRRAGAKAGAEALERAQMFLWFPAGVVRGALMGLGIEASVVGECSEVPVGVFTVKSKGAKA